MYMIPAFLFVSLAFCADRLLSDRQLTTENSPPKVEILMPVETKVLSWGAQVRYALSVSDAEDGDSRYGEINAKEVLLEVEYFPGKTKGEMQAVTNQASFRQAPEGLALMTRSTCFGCHADKTRLAGPSFSEIAKRYAGAPAVYGGLASHIVKGSSGVWGSLQMPAHPDLTQQQATQIAMYIIEQGANAYSRVYSGLEGAFTVLEKPDDDAGGVFVVTASYIDTSGARGQHSIVLETSQTN